MKQMMSVQVRKAQIRTSPSFLGKVIQAIRYGEQVTTHLSQDGWAKVSYKGNNGWLHTSALSNKEIVLDPSSQKGRLAASSDELTLAGKGFNKQVEDQFRKRNRDISFAWVDRAERYTVSQREIQQFMQNGKLQHQEEK